MTTTHEARAPKAIMERAASALSLRGVDPKHIPSTSPSAIRPADWALAIQIAAQEDPAGYLCLRSRWLGDSAAMAGLAVELAKHGRGRVKERHLYPLASLAVRQYCSGGLSEREICRTLKISRSQTWPKMQGAYGLMLDRAYRAEASLGRKLRELMA